MHSADIFLQLRLDRSPKPGKARHIPLCTCYQLQDLPTLNREAALQDSKQKN